MLPVSLEAWEALQPYHSKHKSHRQNFFNFALILFILLKFTTHSIIILFIGPPSIGTCLHYRSCCASCRILTQWNYDFLNLL